VEENMSGEICEDDIAVKLTSSFLTSTFTSATFKLVTSSNTDGTLHSNVIIDEKRSSLSDDDDKTIVVDCDKRYALNDESIDDDPTSTISAIPVCKICEDPVLIVNGSIQYEDFSKSIHGSSCSDSHFKNAQRSYVTCLLCKCMFHTNCVPSLRTRKVSSEYFKCNKCIVNFGVSALFGGGIISGRELQQRKMHISSSNDDDNDGGLKKTSSSLDQQSSAKKLKLDKESSCLDATTWRSLGEFGTKEPIHFDNVISQLLSSSESEEGSNASSADKSELETLRSLIKNERSQAVLTHPPEFEYIRVCRDLRAKDRSTVNADSPVKRYSRGDNNDEAAMCVCSTETGNQKDEKKKRKRDDNYEGLFRTGCGEGCLNRVSFLECTSRTCPFGKDNEGICSNRAIQRRQNARTRPELAMGGKGWGLFAAEEIKAGSFIAEYVGDILDERACEERMKHYSQRHAQHYYMLEVRSGYIIDAGIRGNETRFINHSCAANAGAIKMRCKKEGSCLTETLDEEKDVRVGIYALKDIPIGGEITYDYNFVSYGNEGERWACECGAGSCRKKLGNNKKDVLLDDLDFEHIQIDQSGFKKARRLVPHSGYTFFNDTEANAANALAIKCTSSQTSHIAKSQDIIRGLTSTFLHVEPNNRVELDWARRQHLLILGSKVPRPTRYDNTSTLVSRTKRQIQRKGLLSCMLNRCEQVEKGLHFLSKIGCKDTKLHMQWSIYGFSANEFLKHYGASEEDAPPAEENDNLNALNQFTDESSKNDNSCSKCQGIGSLLCCDDCSRAYHFSCVGKIESDIDSKEKWRCPECVKVARAARVHASSSTVGILDKRHQTKLKIRLEAISILAGVKM
jgi:hypothetical protein